MNGKFESTFLRIVLLGLAVFVGYLFIGGSKTLSRGNKSFSTDMKELRKKFNEDKGKVRVLLLLSPT